VDLPSGSGVIRARSADSRYTIEQSDTSLRITIHPERGAWGAVIVELAVIPAVSIALLVLVVMGSLVGTTSDGAPLLVWLFGPLFLFVGVSWRTYKNVWHVAGCERITVTADALVQTLSIGPLVRTRRFELAGVTALCVPLENGAWWAEYGVRVRQGRRGLIQFDYHGSAKRLGVGLHVPEGQAILSALEARVARRSPAAR